MHEQLLRLIVRGEFPKDCKLPPEGALGERFGVSRPVIREALARLKADGYVRSQRGSGNVVVRGERAGRPAFPPIQTVTDLLRSYEYRVNVETATAALAAERRTTAEIDAMRRSLAKAESALDRKTLHLLADLNFEFHRGVARATHNPFYVTTLELIPNFVGAHRLDRVHSKDEPPLDGYRRVHEEHVAVFDAVVARDPDRARSEMEHHILAARDHVLAHQRFDPAGTPVAAPGMVRRGVRRSGR
ncbi:MAG: FadR family transcriptional regulator [Burkholderiales bacterium]|nr:FadR family transcriptional regulator [Burkholderiales bacterium]